MKKIKHLIPLVLLLLSVASCHAQNKVNKEPEKTTPNMELNNILNQNFETFNVNWLKENATVLTPSGKFTHFSYEKSFPNYYILLAGNDRSGYYSFYYDNNSYYFLYKTFYVNGKIQEKGRRFNNNSPNSKVGKWYSFDEAGNLIKVEDYDKHFTFTFDDAIQYCIEHNIPLEKGAAPFLESSGSTEIDRRYLPTQDSSVYTIRYFKYNSVQFTIITLDGNTGEELSREEGQMIGA